MIWNAYKSAQTQGFQHTMTGPQSGTAPRASAGSCSAAGPATCAGATLRCSPQLPRPPPGPAPRTSRRCPLGDPGQGESPSLPTVAPRRRPAALSVSRCPPCPGPAAGRDGSEGPAAAAGPEGSAPAPNGGRSRARAGAALHAPLLGPLLASSGRETARAAPTANGGGRPTARRGWLQLPEPPAPLRGHRPPLVKRSPLTYLCGRARPPRPAWPARAVSPRGDWFLPAPCRNLLLLLPLVPGSAGARSDATARQSPVAPPVRRSPLRTAWPRGTSAPSGRTEVLGGLLCFPPRQVTVGEQRGVRPLCPRFASPAAFRACGGQTPVRGGRGGAIPGEKRRSDCPSWFSIAACQGGAAGKGSPAQPGGCGCRAAGIRPRLGPCRSGVSRRLGAMLRRGSGGEGPPAPAASRVSGPRACGLRRGSVRSARPQSRNPQLGPARAARSCGRDRGAAAPRGVLGAAGSPVRAWRSVSSKERGGWMY